MEYKKSRYLDSSGKVKIPELSNHKKTIKEKITIIIVYLFNPKKFYKRIKQVLSNEYYKEKSLKKNIKFINNNSINKDDDYKRYIELQLTHASFGSISKDSNYKLDFFLPILKNFFIKNKKDFKSSSVLCIGVRNLIEIERFEMVGFKKVNGIDLFSINPKIEIMDMHNLTYDSNSFNCIYAADSLEHAYDIKKVINEIIRVSKNGCLVVVILPFDFVEERGSDRHYSNVKSPEYFKSLFGNHVKEVFYEKTKNDKDFYKGMSLKMKSLYEKGKTNYLHIMLEIIK